MGCKEDVSPAPIDETHLQAAAKLDRRFIDVHDARFASHAGAATLQTSQFVVVLRP